MFCLQIYLLKFTVCLIIYLIFNFLGHIDVVNYLLKNEADINKQNVYGITAMHFAAQYNHLQIAKDLGALNAQILKDKNGIFIIILIK